MKSLPCFAVPVRSTVVAAIFATALASLPAPAQVPESAAQRSKDLAALFHDIWEDNLKHNPEYASYLGDKRYNDQLTDYSVQAVNAALERERKDIERLSLIDTTGLSDQEQLSAELMLRSLTEDQEAARFKEWEMPVNQFNGFHTGLAQMVENLPFDNVKDYDDYIERLKKVPTATLTTPSASARARRSTSPPPRSTRSVSMK